MIWHERKLTDFLLSLEHHLQGKFVVKWKRGGYSPTKVRYKRDIEFCCKVNFNPFTEKIKISQAMFGMNMMSMAADYYGEKGRRYTCPSVIPKPHENLTGNAKSLLLEPSGVRYADYSKQAQPNYGNESKQNLLTYAKTETRQYLPWSVRMMEESSYPEE